MQNNHYALSERDEVTEYMLKNGLKVLIKEAHAAPVASCYIWYKVGARNERPGITGITHWVEHMLFKGTPSFPKEELKRVIERNGGQWNGFTNSDYTAYYETLPADKIELGIQIEADRMHNSIFDANEVQQERTVILSEREGAENYPQFLLREEVQAAAYKAHPYQWGVIGWKSDLQSITREDLYNYYRDYYAPNNATLVLAGDFNPDDMLEKAHKYFADIPPGKPVPPPRTAEPEQYGERRVLVRRAGNVAHISIAYHVPAVGDEDIYPLSVLQMVLSSGRSSRLYKAIVHQELATSAYFYVGTMIDPGLAWLAAEVSASIQPERVEEALLAEIERTQAEPITDDELHKAINQAEANFIYAQDSVSKLAERLGYYETIANYKYVYTYLDNIRQVTREDIQRVAAKYLTEDNRTVGYFMPIQPGGGVGRQKAEGEENYYFVNDQQSAHRVLAEGIPSCGNSFSLSHPHPSSAASSDIPTRFVRDNGLVLIVAENHSLPVVSISGRLKAGGKYDTDEQAGIGYFVANMLSKGTESRTWEQIAAEIETVGASINFGGGIETASFGARLLTKDFASVLSVLSDVLLHPSFPEEEIEKYRVQLYSQLKSWDDSPAQVADKEIRTLIYPAGHAYHRRLQGYEETVSKFKREDLFSFYHRYYRPDVAMIAVVGDVDTDDTVDKIRNAFADWKVDGEPADFAIPPVEMQGASKKSIPMMDKSQVEIALGHKGISRTNPDFYAVDVMNRILGGSAGLGRLFNYVRDVEGLAYSVWSSFSAGLGEGPFIAGAGVNPENVERVIQSILTQIKKLKEDGITQGELSDAQNMLIGNFALSMETNGGIANVLLNAELFGLGLDYPQRHAQIYRSVTKEQVEEAAAKYLHPGKCSVVTAGPYESGK